MPALHDLLAQTMLFTAAQGKHNEPEPLSKSRTFWSPKPVFRTFAEINEDDSVIHKPSARVEAALHNEIWRFQWDPAHPATFRGITCNTRGMGMDYSMPASVLRKIEFRQLQIERLTGEVVDLILAPEFLMEAWWLPNGRCTGVDPLWKLEAETDSSMLALFGWKLEGPRPSPLTMEEAQDFGQALIPSFAPESWMDLLKFTAGDPGSRFVCVGPSRYLAAVELVLCKERTDFVPGDLVGFARVHPHLFLWSNEDLARAEVRINLKRPSTGMECGDAHGMKPDLGLLLVTDTNDPHGLDVDTVGKPLPFADNLYDYYSTNPRRENLRADRSNDHPLQKDDELTFTDSRFKSNRWREQVVTRKTLHIRNDRDIRKCARQGQFDNVHMAARMTANIEGADRTTEDIVMLNSCVHDCLHFHVRWGDFLDAPMLRGWGPDGPLSENGAPTVPANQSVFVSFPSNSSCSYRAVAQSCKAGEPQVFCHHGAAYAIDEWPAALSAAARQAMFLGIEIAGGPNPYVKKFRDPWTEFYWRVRYKWENDGPVERLRFNLPECMK